MKSVFRAHIFLMLTTLSGALNTNISKIVMPEFAEPSAIIIIRGASANIFFWLIHTLFIREKIKDKNDYIRLLFCAMFGIAGNQILFYEGLNLTTPINAALFQCGVPVFVMILAFIMAREKITSQKIFGLILSAIGAGLLLIYSGNGDKPGAHLGDIMVTLNALSYAVFLILVQPLTEKYNPFTIVKWIFLFGTIMSIPFGYNKFMQVSWSTMPMYALLSLGYIVVFATLFNYYINVGVLRYVNPSVAGIYVYLQPLFTTIIAVAWEKDTITLEKVSFSILILFGVYLVSNKIKETKA